jgi:hypothetical protein
MRKSTGLLAGLSFNPSAVDHGTVQDQRKLTGQALERGVGGFFEGHAVSIQFIGFAVDAAALGGALVLREGDLFGQIVGVERDALGCAQLAAVFGEGQLVDRAFFSLAMQAQVKAVFEEGLW